MSGKGYTASTVPGPELASQGNPNSLSYCIPKAPHQHGIRCASHCWTHTSLHVAHTTPPICTTCLLAFPPGVGRTCLRGGPAGS
jgi:hypothetical protein